jgi:hypothetical protein
VAQFPALARAYRAAVAARDALTARKETLLAQMRDFSEHCEYPRAIWAQTQAAAVSADLARVERRCRRYHADISVLQRRGAAIVRSGNAVAARVAEDKRMHECVEESCKRQTPPDFGAALTALREMERLQKHSDRVDVALSKATLVGVARVLFYVL